MKKHWIVGLLITLPAGVGLAAAQNAPLHSSSTKQSTHTQTTAAKPLTPKSAMPSAHKSSVVPPNAAKTTSNSSAELARLERQNLQSAGKSSDGKTAKPRPAQVPSQRQSAASGPGINFPYQKPNAKKN
jgi:hypothetical protein